MCNEFGHWSGYGVPEQGKRIDANPQTFAASKRLEVEGWKIEVGKRKSAGNGR